MRRLPHALWNGYSEVSSWRSSPLSENEAHAKPVLAIAATFTAEPLQEALSFWLEELNLPHEIRFAGYNQVFQAILDPHGLIRSNTHGVNVILVRTEDWAEAGPDAPETFIRALRDLPGAIVVICPPLADRGAFFDLAGSAAFPEDVLGLYPVAEVFDPAADTLGHVPYTPEFFVALATWIARRVHAVRAAPYKAIALDCDNTLWQGICGEDGPSGVVLDEGRKALQEFLARQREVGMLLCLCSKNNEADVLETFRAHPEWPLRIADFAARRINWDQKSANLASLAEELGLGLDSFIFIDDDLRECAEALADRPEVLTLPLPQDDVPGFLRHVWAFDKSRITGEDRERAAQYTRNAERRREEKHAGSFADFIANLGLYVQIAPALEEELPRVAQLTQRTNQMNLTTVRRSELELRALLQEKALECLTVKVADRFGDYGLVGAMLFETSANVLSLDTFLLSCRALGRGVEHRMLSRLGEIAVQRGLAKVQIGFRETARNSPARVFLESIGWNGADPHSLAPDEAARIQWTPATEAPPPASAPQEVPRRRFDDYAQLASALRTVEQISAWLRRQRQHNALREVPAGSEPRNDLERQLTELWKDLLGLNAVGRDESFFDLGGHSLLAIQMLSRIQREFGADLSLDVVYGGPLTIAELARAIELGELGAVSPAEYEALLAEIEALPDDEVRALLNSEGSSIDS